jgi:phosphoglucomutase
VTARLKKENTVHTGLFLWTSRLALPTPIEVIAIVDGQIRMDPSSPYAMARLVDPKERSNAATITTPAICTHRVMASNRVLTFPSTHQRFT